MPFQDVLVGDLLGAIDDHEIEPLMHYAVGQGVAWIRERRTVAEVYAQLLAESRAALGAVARWAPADAPHAASAGAPGATPDGA
jgi:hypothetical protein